MRYKGLNLYDRMFTKKTLDLMKCLTVGEFKQYLIKFCKSRSTEEYIEGYICKCNSYTLDEDNGMQKIYIVDEKGRLFLKISAIIKLQFVDDDIKTGIWSDMGVGDLFRLPNSIWMVDRVYKTDNPDLYYKTRFTASVVCSDYLFAGSTTLDAGLKRE